MNERYSFIAENSKHFSVKKMAKIEKVSTSGYYDWLKREASPRMVENEKIYHDIEELFLASRRSCGARRIANDLTRLYGRPINRKRVQRLMNEHGLMPKGRKKFVVTTDSSKQLQYFRIYLSVTSQLKHAI